MWTDILEVAKQLYAQVEAAQENKEQAQLIGKRVKSLLTAIKDAGSNVVNAKNEQALTDLKEVLGEANSLIKKFSGKHFLIKFVKAQGYQKELTGINAKLSDLIQTFSVVAQMQSIMDSRHDREAMQADLTSIFSLLEGVNDRTIKIEGMEQRELDELAEMKGDIQGIADMLKQAVEHIAKSKSRPTKEFWVVATGGKVGGSVKHVEIGERVKVRAPEDMSAGSEALLGRLMDRQARTAAAVRAEQREFDHKGGIVAPGAEVVGDVVSERVPLDSDIAVLARKLDEQPAPATAAAMAALAREQAARTPQAAGADPASGEAASRPLTQGPTSV